ncbi:hypothetical protein AVEN_136145-1 [Araneus ventricosus]|uniref:Uncharacterized protein n=1 Tax=Araneus ventricosus TaxID=182803 RepID=A0A4Y2W961_ARAVE|nr:hypothetical protein AVEN_136145-1 [Araneus ventricosus]
MTMGPRASYGSRQENRSSSHGYVQLSEFVGAFRTSPVKTYIHLLEPRVLRVNSSTPGWDLETYFFRSLMGKEISPTQPGTRMNP